MPVCRKVPTHMQRAVSFAMLCKARPHLDEQALVGARPCTDLATTRGVEAGHGDLHHATSQSAAKYAAAFLKDLVPTARPRASVAPGEALPRRLAGSLREETHRLARVPHADGAAAPTDEADPDSPQILCDLNHRPRVAFRSSMRRSVLRLNGASNAHRTRFFGMVHLHPDSAVGLGWVSIKSEEVHTNFHLLPCLTHNPRYHVGVNLSAE